jgi:phosphoribosyl 1,2-cyclic phosphodiesterase
VRIKIWGCRGSLAAPGPDTVRYGGNTSCLEVRLSDGTLIVLDAGTGIRRLGKSLGEDPPSTIHLLLTHLHLDHLLGLGFFPPMWKPDCKLHIWGPSSAMRSLQELIERYLSPPFFPLQLGDVAESLEFHDNPFGDWNIGNATITANYVTHQGPTIGYRIRENGTSFAYIPDHEPARDVPLSDREPEWISGIGIANGADVLFHDSQYSEEEYGERIGWGHSAIHHAITFAKIAEVKQLIMFHHDPEHSDEDLELLLKWARDLWGDAANMPILAYEGMEIDV